MERDPETCSCKQIGNLLNVWDSVVWIVPTYVVKLSILITPLPINNKLPSVTLLIITYLYVVRISLDFLGTTRFPFRQYSPML